MLVHARVPVVAAVKGRVQHAGDLRFFRALKNMVEEVGKFPLHALQAESGKVRRAREIELRVGIGRH